MAPAISVSTSSSSSLWGCHSRCSVDAAGFCLHVSSGGSQLFRIAFQRLQFDRRALLHRSQRQGKTRILVSEASDELDMSKIETRELQKLFDSPKTWRNNNKSQLRNNNIVFVAGASGKVGSRTVRELLKLGFKVRAGVRNVEKAKTILQDAPQLYPRGKFWENFLPIKLFKFLSPTRDQLEILECNLEIVDGIDSALGNANVVICCIGASEKEVLDVTGPYRIDYQATKNLIVAATKAQVRHFVLVTSLGTTKLGWPASVLNLFWGVLIWKAKAEKSLQESGLSYTIVRPGGMERPTDAYKETHNLRLAMANSLTGGQVSNLQIAELLAFVAKNLYLAENKILEVVAEIDAPLTPIEEMLAKIPQQQRDELIIKEESGKLTKSTLPKKVGQAEEEKKRELRMKFEGDFLALKEEETQAISKKLSLQKQKVKVLKQVEAATIAVIQAKALANALVVSANRGQILTEREKKKVMQSAIEEALSKEKTKTEPSVKAVSLSPQTKSKMVLNQAMLPQDIAVRSAQIISQIQFGESAKSDKGIKNLNLNVKSLSGELNNKLSRSETVNVGLHSAQPQHNDNLQPGGKTSCTELTDKIPKDKVKREGKKKLISNSTIKVDAKEGQEEQSPGSQIAAERKILGSNPETLETDDTTVEKAKEESLTISKASRKPFASYSRRPDTKPPASPDPSASVSQPSSITAKENGLDINRKAIAKLVGDRERIALEKAKASLSWYPDVKPPTSPSSNSPNPSKIIISREDTTLGTLVRKSKSSKAVGDLELEARQPKSLNFSFPKTSMTEIKQVDIRQVALEKTKAVVAREALALKLARAEATFKWPWQRSPAAASSVSMQNLLTSGIDSSFATSSTVVGSASGCLYRTQPLSPYTRYPDLKPPTSPTPISPVSSESPPKNIGKVKTKDPGLNGKIVEESKSSKPVLKADSELSESISSRFGATPSAMTEIEVDTCRIAREQAKAAVAREALALQLARAETSFKWSWRGHLDFENSAPLQKLSIPVTKASVTASSPIVGSMSGSVFKAYSLSPYTRYPDVKPPTSPSPNSPKIIISREDGTPGTLVGKSKLSKAVGDLESELRQRKLQISMTEIDQLDIRRVAVEKTKAVVAREALALKLAQAETSFKWPWQISPTAAGSSSMKNILSPGIDSSFATSSTVVGSPSGGLYRTQPLSPYTRYPDLKPPTTPTPISPVSSKSPRKIIGKVKTTDPAVNGIILESSESSKAIREADSELSQSISSRSGVIPSAMTEIEVDTCRIAREQAKAAVAREALALQLARAETSFKFSWKELLVFSSSAPLREASFPVTEASVAPSPAVGSPSEFVFKAYSLSPYTRYADLKPPTSPTPATSAARKTPIDLDATMKEAGSLVVDGTLLENPKSSRSIGMFESNLSYLQTSSFDLTPLTSTEVDIIDIRKIAVEKAKASVAREALALQLARNETSFQWPWQQPTVIINSSSNQDFPAAGSETKILPTSSQDTGLSSETVYEAPTLSPYTRYSDLKPPTSSTPRAP